MKRVVITGAHGLIGWHAHARLHAANCAAAFDGSPSPFEIRPLGHKEFEDDANLHAALDGAEGVLHFAGVNRAETDAIVEAANPAIATRLVDACTQLSVQPHLVYANSTHAASDTPYGRSKRIAGNRLESAGGDFTNLILPHIFGEGARPNYNNVTATFIEKILNEEEIKPNSDGQVKLLHAGTAAQLAIDALLQNNLGELRPTPQPLTVPQLLDRLTAFHADYEANIFPDLQDPFELALFNTYRAASYPESWPRPLKLNTDPRGTLYEAVKGGGGGQCFLSWTEPGVTRGNHFHLSKVERFLVVKGQAIVRIRKVLSEEVWEYRVNGNEPAPLDMPTLHTHSIENIGKEPLLTLFWTQDLFDPQNPDTFADKVLK